MMKLTCKDVTPSTTCSFEATGETAADVAKTMLEHARKEHTADIASMTDDQALKVFESKAHA